MHFRVTLFLFLLASSLYAQKYTISGYVKDASSGEVLIGATVVDKNQPGNGMATNIYGYYSFELPQGDYTIMASYIGYATTEVNVKLKENISLNFSLEERGLKFGKKLWLPLLGVMKNVSSVKMSTEKLQIERIKSMPALFGEVDVVKSLQLLPGVSTAGEGTSGMFVRGGSSDQNLILT